MVKHSDYTMAHQGDGTFPILEKTGKGWSGSGCKQPYKNTNTNVVEYKGLVGAVTSGATTTIRGVGRNLRYPIV